MRKKIIVIVIMLGCLISVMPPAFSQTETEDRKAKDDLYSQIELFSYVLTTVQADYVEEQEPKTLIYGALRGMLSALDPHSQFMDPDEYKELKTETEGKFGGLGIEISIRDGLLTVITPIEDTPAWKVGIQAGDKIVKIEDEMTKEITLNDAVKKLRGKPGTDVNITVLRTQKDEFKVLDFKITREVITVQDIKDAQVLEDNIGYIRLTEFREDSAVEFHKALNQLEKDGATALIVDMRNNPGGLLNVAIDITEFFLPEGQTIVSTRGRHESQNSIAISTGADHFVSWPVVVMINEGSASGSEIFAGALKDNKRAILLGTKSFGKGSVQSVIPLPDGSGLRLTTSKYFTPSGESIHEKGITPDIIVEHILPAEEDPDKKKEETNIDEIFEKVESDKGEEKPAGETATKESESRAKLLNDNQVISAMNVLRGVQVYEKLK